jgi:hypothetical protein
MNPEIQDLITAALAEQRASNVAYCEAVGAKQAAFADRCVLATAYRGRMASRAYMARALATRIAQQLDRVAVAT